METIQINPPRFRHGNDHCLREKKRDHLIFGISVTCDIFFSVFFSSRCTYSLFSSQAKKKEKIGHSTKTNQSTNKPKNRKNRKRTESKHSSRTIGSGYIDLEVSHQQEGTKCSCLQDVFINVVFLFGKGIKEQMYKLFPPMEKNASLSKIISLPV